MAEARTENETTVSQGYAMPILPWTGYGRFSTVYGRRTKAEFAEEFYARNALVQNSKLAQHNLDGYCHRIQSALTERTERARGS